MTRRGPVAYVRRRMWQILDASDDERAAFASLAAVLARAGDLAAPANRQREVRRIELGGRVYYLKIFHRTQAKNRWRNRLTQPRCGLDAEREHAVGAALRARGIETARPVALGRRGPASYYLCAAVPGASLRTCLERGGRDPDLVPGAALFCGEILRRGVVLPDLSAEHVFVLDSGAGAGSPRFAVIDLHNGRLASRPRRRDVRRMLRHCQRSVRDLPLPRRAAQAFAVRLLRAAGLGARARTLLAGLPPLDTHARYDAPGKAEAYTARNPARTQRELRCLRRVWPGRPGDRVLDAPCGAGRLAAALAALGAEGLGLDRSAAMLQRAALAHPERQFVRADSAHLPLRDNAVDGVVVFRFLHHLEPNAARRVIAEATRVARHYVVVSFFHPLSTHGLARRLTSLGAPRRRHAIGRRQLRRWFLAEGFRPSAWAAELPWLREFWVVAFVRESSRAGR